MRATYKRRRETALMVILAFIAVLLISIAGPDPAEACACGGVDSSQWVAWFNVQDAYFRCTSNVAPPVGFAWGSNCLLVPIV